MCGRQSKMELYCCVLAVLTISVLSCSASRVTFKGSPDKVSPISSKSLQLRCTVLDSSSVVGKRQQVTPTPTSSTLDMPHVTSIIISKLDLDDNPVHVASISTYDDKPTANVALFGDVQATGETEPTTIVGEQGFLQVSWEYPSYEQTGTYTCEVFGVDSSLHPVSLTMSEQILYEEPAIPDIVTFIVENNKLITQLQQNLSAVIKQCASDTAALRDETHKSVNSIQSKLNSVKSQLVQTGTATCNHYVAFPKPYTRAPVLFTAPKRIISSATSSNSILRYEVNVQVNQTGFTATCTTFTIFQPTTAFISWLAIDH